MAQIVRINEFPIRSMAKSGTAVFIGPPESGKTFMMSFMTYALKHIYPVSYSNLWN